MTMLVCFLLVLSLIIVLYIGSANLFAKQQREINYLKKEVKDLKSFVILNHEGKGNSPEAIELLCELTMNDFFKINKIDYTKH